MKTKGNAINAEYKINRII